MKIDFETIRHTVRDITIALYCVVSIYIMLYYRFINF